MSSAPPERRGAHRLAASPSADLRSASEQPIDWHPWGPEPFALAARTDRPILLDVGAAWCHWCHVMDEGTYSDPEVARLILQHFVAVKVDRDEHPEVDRRYQRQVSALTGQGGWPLTAFLTPAGEVFLGGTYFPAQDAMGRPGFRRVLKEVARIWREEPGRARENAGAIRAALARIEGTPPSAPAATTAFVAQVRDHIHQSYDVVNGGFGSAPKFPHPTAVSFLLWEAFAHGDDTSAARASETLRRMVDGGLYDQLGGGFHRYAVDEGWHVPHFEKMAADNGPLLGVLVEGARRFGDARLLEAIAGTVGWIRGVLGDPAGGFAASQDADNAPGDDGGYFTWSRPELKAVLAPEELRLVSRVFGVGADGRMPHDPERNVLYRLQTLAEASEGLSLPAGTAESVFAGAVAKLARARAARPPPAVDRARYANLNGALVRALVPAARLGGDALALEDARRAADVFLRTGFRPEQGVAHQLGPDGASGCGQLDDQAEFALGLLELAGATLDRRYLDAAEAILAVVDREFPDATGLLRDLAPGLYDGPLVGALAEPTYPLEDSPHLAANAAVALAHLRHAALTGRTEGVDRARSLVAALVPRVGGAGLFSAGTALAAGLLETEAARIVIEGTDAAAERLARAAEGAWHPNAWVFRGIPPAPFTLPEELVGQSGGREARALICFGTRCLPPVTEPAELSRVLLRGGRSSTP